MNVENMRKWIAALRSGDYDQGQNELRSIDDQFCCLGVLCNLSDPNIWRKPTTRAYRLSGWQSTNMPPASLFDEYTGLGDRDEAEWFLDKLHEYASLIRPIKPLNFTTYEGIQLYLAEKMNDNGWTFEEIASVLEQVVDAWEARNAK